MKFFQSTTTTITPAINADAISWIRSTKILVVIALYYSILNCVNVKDKDMKNIYHEFIFTNLEEKGRLQYFFHSPSSILPIRDVLGHKTEPHIEIGAENYINPCYQLNNIVPFLKRKEKYLFLLTTCKNKEIKYYGQKYIVGYITKKGFLKNVTEEGDEFFAVCGDVALCSFADSFPVKLLGYSENIRMKLVNQADTKRILNLFKERKNILNECITEIIRLDEKNDKKYKTCRVSREEGCKFEKRGCLRWKISNRAL